MLINKRKRKFYFLSFLKHDFKASLTVFLVALPLCLGISLASNTPVYSGLMAGIIGGLIITLISGSQLSVSGPAAGLTAICAAAIMELGSMQIFFLVVAVAGILQLLLGVFRLGGFTHLIPSSVIKGMLAAIGIILISKQIPLIIGYDQPDFWRNELFNILTFHNGFEHITNLYHHTAAGAIVIAIISFLVLYIWQKTVGKKLSFLPGSFIAVIIGAVLALLFNRYIPVLHLKPSQFVSVPHDILSQMRLPDFGALFSHAAIWRNAVIICFVASLETLLSTEAIDKLDARNRISPKNRELVAQGIGNTISGLVGGLPITAVIVRSSANAEAGARTKSSSFFHGIWLLLTVLLAAPLVNHIPYAVLAVILIRTGYNLAKPKMIRSVYRLGREQFLPFIVTIIAVLLTDLLIGVLIGIVYAIYFLVKHTYRAGYVVKERKEGHLNHYTIDLALNVSFLNKKRIIDALDEIPSYSVVEINGADSVYIDFDILEIFQQFKAKAHNRHIQLVMHHIPEVETIELH